MRVLMIVLTIVSLIATSGLNVGLVIANGKTATFMEEKAQGVKEELESRFENNPQGREEAMKRLEESGLDNPFKFTLAKIASVLMILIAVILIVLMLKKSRYLIHCAVAAVVMAVVLILINHPTMGPGTVPMREAAMYADIPMALGLCFAIIAHKFREKK